MVKLWHYFFLYVFVRHGVMGFGWPCCQSCIVWDLIVKKPVLENFYHFSVLIFLPPTVDKIRNLIRFHYPRLRARRRLCSGDSTIALPCGRFGPTNSMLGLEDSLGYISAKQPSNIRVLWSSSNCCTRCVLESCKGNETFVHSVLLAFVKLCCCQWLSQQFLSTTWATCYNF